MVVKSRWVGLRRAVLWLPGLLLGVLLLVAASALQRQPSVQLQEQLNAGDVARALQLLRQHNPRYAPPAAVQAVSLSARELELLLNHGGQRWATGSGRVHVEQGVATVSVSVDLARWMPSLASRFWPLGRWVNAEVRLVQAARLPALDALTIGRLRIPAALVQPLTMKVLAWADLADEGRLLLEVVQHVRFAPERVRLVYAWKSGTGERMLGALVPTDQKHRLLAYAQRLSSVLQQETPAWATSMARVMGPLFELAHQRALAGADAKAENRAAVLVLAMYLNGRNLKAVLPPGSAPPIRPMRVTLSNRDDWPLHFIVSAALATEGSSPLSKAIGLFKEVADARGGSGFSFNDMAANRAGTAFGQLAVTDPQRLLSALAAARARHGGILVEGDFMPYALDLPEFMAEPEFVRRFGGVGAPGFLQQMAEIERRVDALPVLAPVVASGAGRRRS